MIEKFHTNPTKQKDQFVVAYIADLDQPLVVVSYAAYLARILHKGLILMHISDKRYTYLTPAEAEPRLQQIRATLPPQEDISYMALKGETKSIIEALPVLIGAVAIVALVNARARRRSPVHYKELLSNFAGCKVAYLTVQEPMRPDQVLKHVAMSVDFKKNSKEKFLWSSYFARFNGSTIHALHYHYTDEWHLKRWHDNMRFLDKIYNALDITYTPHEIPDKSTFMDVNALRYCVQEHYQLLISLTTDDRDALEFFIGTQEQHIIVNSHHLPVLFLNPREDLYIICD